MKNIQKLKLYIIEYRHFNRRQMQVCVKFINLSGKDAIQICWLNFASRDEKISPSFI